MKPWILTVALCALTISCTADHRTPAAKQQAIAPDPADPSPETYALGSTLTETGAVPKDAVAEAFRRGTDVYLSVDVSGASVDSTIEVNWLDDRDRVIHREVRNVPATAKYAAFASGRGVTSTPGARRATVVINGRLVSEKMFSVL